MRSMCQLFTPRRVGRLLCPRAQRARATSRTASLPRGINFKHQSTTSIVDKRPSKSPPQRSDGDPYHRGYFDFGSASYWDEFYAKKVLKGQGWFEWFESADATLPAVQQAARRVSTVLKKPRLHILHVGAGTSTLGVRLAQSGHSVVNVDVCAAAVEFARENLSQFIEASSGSAVGDTFISDSGPCMFEELNVLDLEARFGAESFDMVVDKGVVASQCVCNWCLPCISINDWLLLVTVSVSVGTLDALLFRDDDGAQRMCQQVHAVLRPCGRLVWYLESLPMCVCAPPRLSEIEMSLPADAWFYGALTVSLQYSSLFCPLFTQLLPDHTRRSRVALRRVCSRGFALDCNLGRGGRDGPGRNI
eukprot:INCI9574.2.p1 GENE.INCI9574.2~~INCI9574.2.p1  ORF type:complete len:362 (-),score=32.04 INCI9574.2:145-1230(-)